LTKFNGLLGISGVFNFSKKTARTDDF